MSYHLTISLPKLKALNLSPTQYVFLWHLFFKKNTNKSCIDLGLVYNLDEGTALEMDLIARDFIDSNYNLTVKSITLLNFDCDRAWEEFKNAYPSRSPVTKRNLRTGLAKARETYKKVIAQDPTLHELAIDALKRDVRQRELQGNGLEYMPAISTYVNQKLWEDYLDEDQEMIKTREMNIL